MISETVVDRVETRGGEDPPSPACTLCGGATVLYHRARGRSYHQCGSCRLVAVPPECWLMPEEERGVYESHCNSPDDAGYRNFLGRLFLPLVERLAAGARGLDVGCGPGPTLSVMFEECGHPVALFDPFFVPDPAVLEARYDFVTATEVVEHLQNPARDLATMWRCVKPGGYLGVMTKLVRNQLAFTTWHYTHDETHVAFFSRETFEWLGQEWGAPPTFLGSDVILFCKPAAQGAADDAS